jgi:anthraniloyl-CoA monooxygenase
MKLRDPSHEVTVIERNKADDTFGWGVVLSDDALDNMDQNDAQSADAIRDSFVYWDDIAVHHKGHCTTSGGHGFAGVGRQKMLVILQARARALGVELQFETEFKSAAEYKDDYDLVVACDGINSLVRKEYESDFKPDIDIRTCKFIWLGTHQKFDDAFTFIFEKTKHGWVWIHAYQFDENTATVIVECTNDTWNNFGFEYMSKEETIAKCEEIFTDHLDGHKLISNADHLRGSAVWMNFPRVICEKWHYENIVLMGDAAATGHFSIGSGSRLAFDSAISLANYLHSEPVMERAFERYQDERRLEVLRLQSAARNSLEWFENAARYVNFDPVQFNYALLTRSQRISHENLRLRDKDWLETAEDWFQVQAGQPSGTSTSPMFTPFKLRDMELKNRIVVSPMAQYKAADGCPADWHFVHYAERAKGGAGLVFTEMTCVSADGRITPGCPGLYAPEHEAAWQRISDFIHTETDAKVCCQIGHAGRKGSTQLGWEEMDAPLQSGNWPLISASAIAWSPQSAVPKAMDRTDMDRVLEQFVHSVKMADRAGFDMIEMHAAHGYLISSFISPLTNTREDAYGGSLENRMRYPLEVFAAMRTAWPDNKPMSVRISANDWVGAAGMTGNEAVEVTKMFKVAGADIIDVSAGQTTPDADPIYGRMFQTPLCDQIRNEAGISTMAVGNIYETDHVNSILMAGRADLVCLARPHLSNPYWTLHAGAALGQKNINWPKPYEPGRDQMYRLAEKAEAMVVRA